MRYAVENISEPNLPAQACRPGDRSPVQGIQSFAAAAQRKKQQVGQVGYVVCSRFPEVLQCSRSRCAALPVRCFGVNSVPLNPAAVSQLRANCFKRSGRETPFVPMSSEPHWANCRYNNARLRGSSTRLFTQNFESHKLFLWGWLTASGPFPNPSLVSPICPQPSAQLGERPQW